MTKILLILFRNLYNGILRISYTFFTNNSNIFNYSKYLCTIYLRYIFDRFFKFNLTKFQIKYDF